MPTNKILTPLVGGNYYHIFNRGINSQTIFFNKKNYDYFLLLFRNYIADYVQVLAYCLLPNHFHFLIKLNDELIIDESEKGEIGKPITEDTKIGIFVSEQFRRLFISYSQAINRQEKRTGSLFNRNFKRILLENDDHLKYLFYYIHSNPAKHGIYEEFQNYRYSSYKAYILGKPTHVSIMNGLELFEGVEGFLNFHSYYHDEKSNLILE